jgi:hypothetical protein
MSEESNSVGKIDGEAQRYRREQTSFRNDRKVMEIPKALKECPKEIRKRENCKGKDFEEIRLDVMV